MVQILLPIFHWVERNHTAKPTSREAEQHGRVMCLAKKERMFQTPVFALDTLIDLL